MLVWLVLIFIAVPLVELYVIVETARSIGTPEDNRSAASG